MNYRTLTHRFIWTFLAIGLTACGGNREAEIEYIERPAEEIYNTAFAQVDRGRFDRAALEFDEVERQHPYSIWARRAMVMASYSYYMQNRYDETIITAQRFLALYPGNKQAPYAYYLIAMSQYERISDVKRDQRATELAREALVELATRFPDTPYARDALLKIELTNDNLAGKEMDIGRFYLKTGAYAAAAKRFSNVVRHYSTTAQTPEALHRLVEVYIALGIIPEAQKAAATLGYNFPDSAWYARSYRLLKSAQ
ncbi:MAG: outer membrane protein assembly factor BamD [Alphaproteobacteria bacterium]|nr:outer membrane protein assembly factor BamD [Alphaproteobacteria bacterium]MBE8220670.1 outer membrane protein assembly factor BamD [Alphaproteobacteria bacterium]